MSKQNYDDAISKIEENKASCFFAGEKSDELINLAEKELGFKFSSQVRHFFKKYGAGSIGAEEIYGVINDNFIDASVPNGVWFTLTERKEIDLPSHLYVLFDSGSDEFVCLDFSKVDSLGEPSVVLYYPGMAESAQQYEVIAEDFGTYLLNIVNEEL